MWFGGYSPHGRQEIEMEGGRERERERERERDLGSGITVKGTPHSDPLLPPTSSS
jgi:hypothetical protein